MIYRVSTLDGRYGFVDAASSVTAAASFARLKMGLARASILRCNVSCQESSRDYNVVAYREYGSISCEVREVEEVCKDARHH